MPANTKIIKDLTVGSVPKVLLTFAMPLFLSGLLQMVYNMVDMMVVGKFVGTEGLSAVAIGDRRRNTPAHYLRCHGIFKRGADSDFPICRGEPQR